MMKTVAAISAALMLGTMSQAALAQARQRRLLRQHQRNPPPRLRRCRPPSRPPQRRPSQRQPPGQSTIVGAKPPPPVNACKGLAETDCGAKVEECCWIKAYKTKAGKQVAGYCKSKPKPKAAAAKPAPEGPDGSGNGGEAVGSAPPTAAGREAGRAGSRAEELSHERLRFSDQSKSRGIRKGPRLSVWRHRIQGFARRQDLRAILEVHGVVVVPLAAPDEAVLLEDARRSPAGTRCDRDSGRPRRAWSSASSGRA